MILDYLDISQTLEYLEKQTGYKYNFDNLKELNFSGKLDVFFHKSCTIYNRDRSVYTPPPVEVCGKLVSPFPYYLANGVKVIKGVFFLKDVLTDNNDSEFLHFKTKVTVEAVYKQTNLSFDDDRNYEYERGDTGYLSSAEFFDIGYLPDGSMNSAFLRNKAISSISYDELRFKKAQLDELINVAKVCTTTNEKFNNLKYENEEQKQRIEELEKEIAQIRMPEDGLKDVSNQAYEKLAKEFEKTKKQLMDATVELDDNTAASYQTTIGILLEIMKAPKGTEDKPAFPSEAVIIGLATEEAIFRQGKTSLENRFRVAKEALDNERKKPHNLKRSSNSS